MALPMMRASKQLVRLQAPLASSLPSMAVAPLAVCARRYCMLAAPRTLAAATACKGPRALQRHFLGMPGSLSGEIGQQPAPSGDGTIPVVLVSDAKKIWSEFGVVVDVREKSEVDEGMIEGALHVPLATLLAQPLRPEFKGKRVLAYCRAGIRSAKAVEAMQKAGIDAVNLAGGYLAWQGDQ